MPPLAIHTSIARKLADRLRSPVLDAERGNLYLGSTAPDIRVITRWERRRTHFFDLENFNDQHCVTSFFNEHPSLADAGALDPRTCAFIAGYISHLEVDAIWIDEIYRPFFGERSPMGGSLRANIMDRALQFSMDAEARADPDAIAHVVDSVARCDLDIDVGFIDRDTLSEWHRVISAFVKQQPDWERFRARSRRHILEIAGVQVGDEEYEDLARSLPDIVDEALRYLGRDRLESVIGESIDASERVVRSYLKCGL